MANHIGAICILLLLTVLPLAGTAVEPMDNNVIQSIQILSTIERGEPVDFSGIIVKGDLNLEDLNLSATNTINSPLKIYNSIILDAVKFNNTIIEGPVSFEKTIFLAPANFYQTRFNEDVNFEESQFKSAVLFRKTQFNGLANFRKAQFGELADFWKSHFMAGSVDFEGSQFRGPANFKGVQFDIESVNFGWSQFNGSVSFWDTKFNGLANFQGAQFKDSLDLTLAQFYETVDFMGARFDKELYFSEVKFVSFKVNWDSFKDNLISNGPMYIALVKNFKELEQFEDADSCYYEYRNWKMQDRPLSWLKFFDYIAWISCGYDVRWQYTIISGIVMIVLFGVYFEFNYLAGTTASVLTKRNAQSQNPNISNLWRSIKKSISFSAMVLLSLPSDWFPYGKEEYSKSIKSHLYAAILERLIGWGLMLLLIGTLTRLMVRY